MNASHRTIPLFPLHAVLFPGGPLELRIFEPRYLEMVGECLRQDSGFGVCLIESGQEVGSAAATYPVGTFGRITYWQRRRDGLFGVTVTGEQRFRILERRVQRNQLIVAEVAMLPNDPPVAVDEAHLPLVALLRSIVRELGQPYIKIAKHYEDAGWVGSRLAELLPLPLPTKQLLLQMSDPLQRLERLRAMLASGERCW